MGIYAGQACIASSASRRERVWRRFCFWTPPGKTRWSVRNTVWNLGSLATPMLVALVTIPALIRALGSDRFGILALAWMLIGYCSLFDLGLGRALTKLISEGAENHSELAGAVWTALALM